MARRVGVGLIKLVASSIALVPLLGVALLGRMRRGRRRRDRMRPRVVWGPIPVVAIKYWSEALRELGYESTTLASVAYEINSTADFDRMRASFGPRSVLFEPWRDHAMFAWALWNADVYCTFLNGGFLANTPLRQHEGRLLRLARMRLVVSPYGSDVAVAGYLGPVEDAMAQDYPSLVADAERIRARVDWFLAEADLVIRTLQPGYLPHHDVLWPSQLAVDTTAFVPGTRAGKDGRNGRVTVIHAPNHRTLKSTDDVIDAVACLQDEGLDVELTLLERRPNSEVRDALATGDILAEQFLCGFGLLAIEGMASGIPVLTRTGWMDEELLRHPSIRDAPLVDTTPEEIRDHLRELVVDPKRRAALGAAGRRHVLAWNSYGSVGRIWAGIVEAAWERSPVDAVVAVPTEPRTADTLAR